VESKDVYLTSQWCIPTATTTIKYFLYSLLTFDYHQQNLNIGASLQILYLHNSKNSPSRSDIKSGTTMHFLLTATGSLILLDLMTSQNNIVWSGPYLQQMSSQEA